MNTLKSAIIAITIGVVVTGLTLGAILFFGWAIMTTIGLWVVSTLFFLGFSWAIGSIIRDAWREDHPPKSTTHVEYVDDEVPDWS